MWVKLFPFSRSVESDSLRPHGLQHSRPPCPSPSPGACSNSCPLSRGCHATISCSAVPFSSRPQSFPASGAFPMRQVCTRWPDASGGRIVDLQLQHQSSQRRLLPGRNLGVSVSRGQSRSLQAQRRRACVLPRPGLCDPLRGLHPLAAGRARRESWAPGAISSSGKAGLHKEKVKVALGSLGAGRWGDRGGGDVSPGGRARETPGR